MDFKTLLGLPAHPLVVHAAVVLLPLAAIGTVMIAVWPKARRGVIGWAVAVLSIAAFGFVGLAQKTGGALADHVQPTALTREHVAMGDAVLPWAFIIMGVACSVMALEWFHGYQASRADGAGGAGVTLPWVRPISLTMAAVAILAALAGTVQVYRVGHSGAKASWRAVDMNGPSTGGGEQGG